MVILPFVVSHDSVTERWSRLLTEDHIATILWFSVSEHSKHRHVVVDYSMADLTSAEYEQDLHRDLHSRC